MRLIDQSAEIFDTENEIKRQIIKCAIGGGMSHGTDHREDSEAFVRRLMDRGHDSVLEHGTLSVTFVTNRVIANQLVRHRFMSVTQESLRYVQKDDLELTLDDRTEFDYDSMERQFEKYREALKITQDADMARMYLPLGTTTRLFCTANFREWRHIFRLRLFNKGASYMMRCLMALLWDDFPEVMKHGFEEV